MPAQKLPFPHLLSILTLFFLGFPGLVYPGFPFSSPQHRPDLTRSTLALMQASTPNTAAGSQGTLSISASDFRPSYPSNSYENHGRYLIHLDSAYTDGYYVAPLLLPQGATLTRFTLVFRDNSTSNLTATLYRDNSSGMGESMAQLDSSGSYSSPW